MAYSQAFLKLTFGGFQAGGQDIWTCGINMSIQTLEGAPVTEPQAISAFEAYADSNDETLPGLFQDFVSNSNSYIPSAVNLTWVKLAVIGENGQYLADSKTWETTTTNGGRTGAYVPQVSLVVTLASDKRADPGKYQRFYLPTITPTNSGSYRPTGTGAVAAHAAALLADLSDIVTGNLGTYSIRPAAVTSSPKHTGNYLPITRVRVGDVYDTQRRRRNKIGETYQEIDVLDPVPVPVPPEE